MQKRLLLVCGDSLCPRELPGVSWPGLGEAGRYKYFDSLNKSAKHLNLALILCYDLHDWSFLRLHYFHVDRNL